MAVFYLKFDTRRIGLDLVYIFGAGSSSCRRPIVLIFTPDQILIYIKLNLYGGGVKERSLPIVPFFEFYLSLMRVAPNLKHIGYPQGHDHLHFKCPDTNFVSMDMNSKIVILKRHILALSNIIYPLRVCKIRLPAFDLIFSNVRITNHC